MASSGNFATMNPLHKTSNNVVYSNGNLTTSPTSNWSTTTFCRSTIVIPKDKKIYVEMRLDVQNGEYVYMGCATNNPSRTNNVGGDGAITFGSISKVVNGTTTNSFMSVASAGDIVQIAIDGSNNKVWYGKNNTWQGSGDPANGTNEAGTINTSNSLGFDISIVTVQNSNGTVTMNFGQDSTFGGSETAGGNADGNGFGDFAYAPPTGFLALCTGNLSVSDDIDPAQTDDDFPQKQFNVVTYNSTGSGQSITGVGFQPDLVWVKWRGGDQGNGLFDSSRGTSKVLQSDSTGAENTSSGLTSFDSDGYSMGEYYNQSGRNYVGWCWRANGGTTSSNSDGSITSTVQANTKAGFSIITYAGTGSNATIGHGLSAKPDFFTIKNRDGGTGMAWTTYHSSLGATKYLELDAKDQAYTGSTRFNDTEPTTSTISLGTISILNTNGDNFVCYAWHSVEGYSKFGSYEGNGNSNGPFIYTGFRPRLLFMKNADTSSRRWTILDSARNTFNPVDSVINWDESQAEYDSSARGVDILSNGFKIRGNDSDNNTSGDTYVYGAWGDVPFKYNNTF